MMFPDGLHNFFSLRQGQNFFGQLLITSATLDLDIHVAKLVDLKKGTIYSCPILRNSVLRLNSGGHVLTFSSHTKVKC